MRQIIKLFIPPIIIKATRWLTSVLQRPTPPDWEYLGDSWDVVNTEPTDCWENSKVAEVMGQHWEYFCEQIRAPGAFGLSNESVWKPAEDRNFHNDVMSFAYVVSLASQAKQTLKILDWGGSIGHYYQIATSLFPEQKYNYTVKEVPSLCNIGRKLNRNINFIDTIDDTTNKNYDLVISSSSIHYTKDWQKSLEAFTQLSSQYIYVTRFPVVENHKSFVFLQRPDRFGYETEYAAWCINKAEFLDEAAKLQLKLEREFLLIASVKLPEVNEPMQFSGFLFSKQDEI